MWLFNQLMGQTKLQRESRALSFEGKTSRVPWVMAQFTEMTPMFYQLMLTPFQTLTMVCFLFGLNYYIGKKYLSTIGGPNGGGTSGILWCPDAVNRGFTDITGFAIRFLDSVGVLKRNRYVNKYLLKNSFLCVYVCVHPFKQSVWRLSTLCFGDLLLASHP